MVMVGQLHGIVGHLQQAADLQEQLQQPQVHQAVLVVQVLLLVVQAVLVLLAQLLLLGMVPAVAAEQVALMV